MTDPGVADRTYVEPLDVEAAERIIQAEQDARREEVASKMGFSAYGVTQNDDPLSQAMRGLIDNAA